jgi:hypothetical protein
MNCLEQDILYQDLYTRVSLIIFLIVCLLYLYYLGPCILQLFPFEKVYIQYQYFIKISTYMYNKRKHIRISLSIFLEEAFSLLTVVSCSL